MTDYDYMVSSKPGNNKKKEFWLMPFEMHQMRTDCIPTCNKIFRLKSVLIQQIIVLFAVVFKIISIQPYNASQLT